MIVIVIFVVFTLLYPSHLFEMHCPTAEQWPLRADITCSSPGQYTCLFDFDGQTYNESCEGPLFAFPGERVVTSNDKINKKPCTPERFQPFKFSSKQGSDCLLQKRKCSEEGLVIYGNGTFKEDNTCRCDYTRGFAFSSTYRTDPCSCNPAIEDCSCYKIECDGSLVLSPDYLCINETETQGTFNCSFISDTESKKPTPKVVSVNNSVSIGDTKAKIFPAAMCAGFIIVFILVFCIGYCQIWTAFRKMFEKDYFVEPLEKRVHCFEGDNVTLSCTVNKKGTTATWWKDGTKLNGGSTKGKMHELEIHNVKVENKGSYKVCVKKIDCSSLLLVQVVTPEQVNFLRLLHLLETVAQSVVRNIFDRKFLPHELKRTLDQNKLETLDLLREKKHLKKVEYDMLFAEKMVEYYIKFKLQGYHYHRITEIEPKESAKIIENEVSLLYHNVKGKHEVSFIQFEPGLLVVVKLTSRSLNDKRFLEDIIKRAVEEEGYIGNFRTESSGFDFIEMGKIDDVPVSSEDFNIRLMMILMKNLAHINISEKIPLETDTSESADLSRIKFTGIKLEYNIDKKISDEEFEENWKQLTEAIKRCGRKYESMCQLSKKYKPYPHQCQRYLQSRNMESVNKRHQNLAQIPDVTTSVESLNIWEDKLIRQEARKDVQKIFDEQFPPKTLRKAMLGRSEYLGDLNKQKAITESQWNLLVSENVSSGMFDTNLMTMLLKDSQLKGTLKLVTIEYLNNLLNRTYLDCSAIKKALTEVGKEEVQLR